MLNSFRDYGHSQGGCLFLVESVDRSKLFVLEVMSIKERDINLKIKSYFQETDDNKHGEF